MEPQTSNHAAPLRVIWSLGHSNRTLDEWLELLAAFGIRCLVDVRRFPFSRRHPHFNRESLAATLPHNGIVYEHLEALGGRRRERLTNSPNGGWRVEGFNAYADYMLTPAFAEALERLEQLAYQTATALFCAEVVPWRCHRRLIADALLVRDWRVIHILGPSATRDHVLPPIARWDGQRLIYPREPSLFSEA